MTAEYPSNENLLARRKKHFIPTAYLYHKEPIQLVKAKGPYVWDHEGKQYLDAIGGIISISAGHNHPRIKQKMHEMLECDEIQHTSLLYLTKYPVELAEMLVAEAPEGLDQVAFTNSGSEANEFAFMAARHHSSESVVVSLRHGYHGGTAAAVAQCGQHSWRFRGQPVGTTTSALEPNCYRCPFGQKKGQCGLECAKNVETTIQTATHGNIAAFIAEPVMGVGGFITPDKEYFDAVTTIVHNYGGQYISDEVQTGAGRCGKTFLVTKELGIDADMITMAKGLGNGAAIGAVITRPAIVAEMSGKFYFNTFGGDPYQTMQAKVNMEVIKEERMIENAHAMGTRIMDGLRELMKTHPLIGDVRGRGLLIGFELVKDRTTKAYATEETADLMDRCKAKGLLLGKGGLFGNVMRVAPPLSITSDQADFILTTIDASLHEMRSHA